MNMLPKKALDGSETMRRVADDFEILESNIARLERANTEYASTNERLLQENGILREQLSNLQHQKDMLQAYAVAITTKIDIIVDVAESARREAMSSTVRHKAPDPKAAETKVPEPWNVQVKVNPDAEESDAAAAMEELSELSSASRIPRIGLVG